MKNLIIDGGKFDSVESFYTYIVTLFPQTKEYFGNNLDALYDILSEESFEKIQVKQFQKMRFELGDSFFMSFQEILFELDVQDQIVFEV